jgi:hypothetical protein
MSNRSAIQVAIQDYVVGAITAGLVIDVTAVALTLSSAYPQSGFTIDELCQLVEKAAMDRRGVILSDRKQA